MSNVSLIKDIVSTGWQEGVRVGIVYQVTKDGHFLEGLSYPPNSAKSPEGSNESWVVIDVSTRACKSFTYFDDYNEFVYEVSIKGKPFLGNIPPNLIVAIIDLDTGISIGSKFSEPVKKEVIKPTLVSVNLNITPSKSKANLHIVKDI